MPTAAANGGRWHRAKNGPTPGNGFTDLADILINMREDGGVIDA
jgi:hypothetical protein